MQLHGAVSRASPVSPRQGSETTATVAAVDTAASDATLATGTAVDASNVAAAVDAADAAALWGRTGGVWNGVHRQFVLRFDRP